MAHTNQTPNYALSEFIGTDKPAWLVDYNGDMEKIDLGMKAAKDVADAAKAEANQCALDIAAVTVTANAADAKATEALANMGDTYDASSTYSVGDLTVYNGLTYICNTNITIPEAFNGDHWDRYRLSDASDDVQALKAQESVIGNITANSGSFVGNSSSTYKRVAELTTLPAGTYIFSGYCDINANSDVTLTLLLRAGGTILKTIRGNGTAGGGLCITYPLTIVSNADINIALYDDIANITARGELRAIRIK